MSACDGGDSKENSTSNNANSDANNDAGNIGNADVGEDVFNVGVDLGDLNVETPDMGDNVGPGPDPEVVLINPGPDDCFAFSNDVDIPLALDGVFDADSDVWRRPFSETDECPAPGLLPDTAALVPYLAVKFCNDDTVEHTYDFEFIGQEGAGGEPPLDDAYLVLYAGEDLPADHTQCLLANDNIEGAIGDVGDSEILGVTVQPGEAITVVATTFTFDPTDGTGTGAYILVVSNAD